MTFSAPRLYLANGVTTMRTTGSVEPYTDLAAASGMLYTSLELSGETAGSAVSGVTIIPPPATPPDYNLPGIIPGLPGFPPFPPTNPWFPPTTPPDGPGDDDTCLDVANGPFVVYPEKHYLTSETEDAADRETNVYFPCRIRPGTFTNRTIVDIIGDLFEKRDGRWQPVHFQDGTELYTLEAIDGGRSSLLMGDNYAAARNAYATIFEPASGTDAAGFKIKIGKWGSDGIVSYVFDFAGGTQGWEEYLFDNPPGADMYWSGGRLYIHGTAYHNYSGGRWRWYPPFTMTAKTGAKISATGQWNGRDGIWCVMTDGVNGYSINGYAWDEHVVPANLDGKTVVYFEYNALDWEGFTSYLESFTIEGFGASTYDLRFNIDRLNIYNVCPVGSTP
jgi:hypothetical protein